MSNNQLVLVDSHVHFHPCFNLYMFLNAANENFIKQARSIGEDRYTGLLLLAETAKANWFEQLFSQAQDSIEADTNEWQLYKTGQSCLLHARCNIGQMYIVAGRQVVTSERMEVLALGTVQTFEDHRPMRVVLNEVNELGALAVVPWGFGKWTGKRGRFLKKLMENELGSNFFLGDNGGRTKFISYPFHFIKATKKNIKILPGSDPLPFPPEYSRPGSFGFSINAVLKPTSLIDDLKKYLLNKSNEIKPFGALENPFRFIRNQIGMQLINLKYRR